MSRAFTVTPLTPLSAALGEVILETRFLEQRWPAEVDRVTIQRALFDLHKEVSSMLVLLDGGRRIEIDERGATNVREAFLATLVLAVLIQRLIARSRREVQGSRRTLAAAATSALRRLLDALDPFVARADAALRQVMLDGVSSEQAAAQIALPV
jgi:hypothetical protein